QFYTIDEIIDTTSKEYITKNFKYILHDKTTVALEYPLILKTPLIRFDKKVLMGYDEKLFNHHFKVTA
ncbi:MAG: hypothetical protein FWG98_15080, partial [Candidatus Cloacimonetes bacterium]|nr:hypothetical protein [Candidatus Cloacimonadota bacterium]